MFESLCLLVAPAFESNNSYFSKICDRSTEASTGGRKQAQPKNCVGLGKKTFHVFVASPFRLVNSDNLF